jgi:hypothetical protein
VIETGDVVDDLAARILRMPTGPDVPVTWFLDIDGVLNVIGRAPHSPQDWPRFIRKAVHNSDWMAWPFCYSPDLMDLINLLVFRRLIQVRWLTTWEHDAYKAVAPQLGLHVGHILGGIDHGRAEAGWWKLRVVQQFREGKQGPFVWTEDEIKEHLQARVMVNSLPSLSGRVVACDETRGLTPAQFARILDYLDDCYASSVRTS